MFGNVFLPPYLGDYGIAIGCCAYALFGNRYDASSSTSLASSISLEDDHEDEDRDELNNANDKDKDKDADATTTAAAATTTMKGEDLPPPPTGRSPLALPRTISDQHRNGGGNKSCLTVAQRQK